MFLQQTDREDLPDLQDLTFLDQHLGVLVHPTPRELNLNPRGALSPLDRTAWMRFGGG